VLDAIFDNNNTLVTLGQSDDGLWQRLNPTWIDNSDANAFAECLRGSFDCDAGKCANAD